jgi:lantibiotic modifying enzyme
VDYREAAIGASEWLLNQTPEDGSLYDGSAGVLLTMLDAHAASGEQRFLDAAHRMGTELAAGIDDDEYSGLYVGIAGRGFALAELGDDAGVRKVVAALGRRGFGPMTDIIVGAAGTICWLAAVGEAELARQWARWLASVGEPATGGTKWMHVVGDDDYMPNFSHGTAGNAYALAAAGLIDEAIAGADHLVAIAERPDGGFRIRHFDDGAPADFPLGWCHGPTGTARLFQLLADKTGDEKWTELRDACAQTVRTSGIPERKEPGFWDNAAACCGSTGVAKFFLGLHRRTGDADHLAFARLMSDDIVDRATVDGDGVRWSNIEHRRPDPVLPPDPGQMQGAAGIASWLFELDRFVSGDASYRRWPDNPF